MADETIKFYGLWLVGRWQAGIAEQKFSKTTKSL